MVPEDDDFDEASERTVVFTRADLEGAVASSREQRAHVLVRMDGSDVGHVTTLSGRELRAGRLARSELCLPFEGVSREHAVLTWKDGSYWVEDLGSANGTFVQGARIQSHQLSDGDVLQFGPRVVFRYSITDAGEERVLRQLYVSSVKDSLTGAYNREYLTERMKAEVAYARRHQTALSVVLLDVDHFKKVNDTYGHQAGDAVLVAFVASLGKTLRTEDIVARYGGEEFVVLLRGTSLESAASVGERLRGLFEATPTPFDGQLIRCTTSAGCAATTCLKEPSADGLIAVADRRLYMAKRTGRNRVIHAD